MGLLSGGLAANLPVDFDPATTVVYIRWRPPSTRRVVNEAGRKLFRALHHPLCSSLLGVQSTYDFARMAPMEFLDVSIGPKHA